MLNSGIALTVAVTAAIQSIVNKQVMPVLKKMASVVKSDFQKNVEPLGKHFEQYLSRTYEKHSILNTLVFRNQQKKLRDLYIPLSLIREGVERSQKEDVILVDGYPKEFISQYRRVLITDTAGMGKSTMTKIMFLSAIDMEAGIPFYVELRKLSKSHTLLDEIRDQLNSLTEEFNDDLMRAFFQAGGFIFFFDGFDEIALSERKEVTEDIKRFIEKAPDNYYILTSRFEQALAGFGDFLSMNIRPLTKNEAYNLLTRYDSNGNTSAQLIEKLESGQYNKINDFLKNPLLVSLLFIGFEYKPEIPLKIHLFYDQVYEAYFNTHDLSKDAHFTREKKSGLDMADFAKVLRSIGFICLNKHRLEFSREDFLEILGMAGKLSCLQIKSTEALMHDLLHSVPLFRQDGINYKWVHKSMQEYYAADYINRDSGNKKEQVLKKIYQSQNINNYLNIIELYSDLDSRSFNQIFVLPILNDFIDYLESPVMVDNPEMESRILRRRQMIYNRDTFFYLFTEKESKMPISEAFKLMHELVNVDAPQGGTTQSVISRQTTGITSGVLYVSAKYSRLSDLLRKKYPELTARIKTPFPLVPKFIHPGEVYHLTEEYLIDNPAAYDELDFLLLRSGNNFMSYDKAKILREMINKTLVENEDVFNDLLSV